MEGQRIELRGVARHLLELGWHPLELPAQQKGPPLEGRTGGEGVDMTPGEVEAAAWVGNLGVRMAEDVVGLDVDAYRGGLDTLHSLIEALGPLPPTCISHSGRDDGSGIRFYRVPPGLRWVSTLAGIDIIRRGHRYACTWPSVHPDGRTYGVWDQTTQAPGELWAVEDLPELPWPWTAHLSRAGDGDTRSHAATGAGVVSFLGVCTEAEAPGYLTVIEERFTGRTAAGHSRHDTMQHCLIWAMECARAGVLSGEVATDRLGALWVASMRPEEARRAALHSLARVTEFAAMLRHAVGKAEARTSEDMDRLHDDIVGVPMVASTPPPLPPDVRQPPLGPPPTVVTPPPLLAWRDLPDPWELEPLRWHAADLVARPTYGELAGPEKSLKTWVGLAIDVGLALGRPVFGLDRFAVAERQRVLLLVGEGGERPWLARIEALCRFYGATPGELRGWLRFTTSTASVSSPRLLEELRTEVEAFRPALVRLDPWYAYAGGMADTRQVTEVGAQLSMLGGLCLDAGASLWITNHTNRSSDAQGLRRISGAGHAEWVDSWMMLAHRQAPDVAAGRYRLRLDVGSRQWGGGVWDLDLDTDAMGVRWRVAEHVEETETDGVEAFALLRAEVLRAGRQARKPLAREAWCARVKRRRPDVRAAFDELVVEGLITEVEPHRFKVSEGS